LRRVSGQLFTGLISLLNRVELCLLRADARQCFTLAIKLRRRFADAGF
jgi:hypothetical protein